MSNLQIQGGRLRRDGVEVFLLADTVWGAFTHASSDEWSTYLRARAAQGFSSVLISFLPILDDIADPAVVESPWVDATAQVHEITPEYLSRARRMVRDVVDAGLIPMLVALWHNYVPGHGANQMETPRLLASEHIDRFADLFTSTFAEFTPIVVTTGDTDWRDQKASATYARLSAALRDRMPYSLHTFHGAADVPIPPSYWIESSDFLTYQSGHGPDTQSAAATYAVILRELAGLPIMNIEPCYEAMGHAFAPQRFAAIDVRAAGWRSVLGGATFGLGYGAHGVWQWYRAGRPYAGAHFASMPLDWKDALVLRGADDLCLLRRIAEEHDFFSLAPRPDLIGEPATRPERETPPNGRDLLTVAANDDLTTIVIYSSAATEIRLSLGEGRYRLTQWDLEARTSRATDLEASGGSLALPMPPNPLDSLHLLTLQR